MLVAGMVVGGGLNEKLCFSNRETFLIQVQQDERLKIDTSLLKSPGGKSKSELISSLSILFKGKI